MGQKSKRSRVSTSQKDDPPKKEPPTEGTEDDQTLSQVFFEHPLIKVGKFIVPPYLIYLSYFFLFLQHPEFLSKLTLGAIRLRPSVSVTDSRQFLIVAPPSSGTVQMSTELESKLNLEVGHEVCDTRWYFVRDGTVSWMHVIRFLEYDVADKEKGIDTICSNGDKYLNMGFHPAAYRPPVQNCSYRSKWNSCWERECVLILSQEWGCAFADTCETNFVANLHQVRNPLRNMESLGVKFCVGGLTGSVNEAFLLFLSALFPHHDFSQDSCIEAVGEFVFAYQTAMIQARKQGKVNAFFRIDDEETTTCYVAEKAGLLSKDSTVYEPNYHKVKSLCIDSDSSNPARQPIPRNHNKVNKGQLSLGWQDLHGGKHGSKRSVGDKGLENKIKKLFKELGYDPNLEPDEVNSLPEF